MAELEISDVSDTARWVAHYRALETERADALFRDPFAARLAGDKGRRIAEAMASSRYTGWSVVIRTCIIDKLIAEYIATKGVDLVVNLGAGLDSRPYRLALPAGLRWVEVDYPHMIDFKEERLRDEKPACRLERIKADLAERETRVRILAGLAATAKNVLVLTEGVIPYLSPEQVAELAGDLRAHASFRYWLAEYFSPRLYRYFQSRALRRQLKNAPFRFFPPDWFGFFAANGWRQGETRYLPEETIRLGREMPLPWWVKALRFLFRGRNEEEFLKISGYVVFEPGPGSVNRQRVS